LRHQHVNLPQLGNDLLRLVLPLAHSHVLQMPLGHTSGRTTFQGEGQNLCIIPQSSPHFRMDVADSDWTDMDASAALGAVLAAHVQVSAAPARLILAQQQWSEK
ncbi:MAG TPA: hypothetical protein VGN97_16450, partial [Mesorhizobium sp.]|nr:hypothetical protein [Mesorhizobium sp.]